MLPAPSGQEETLPKMRAVALVAAAFACAFAGRISLLLLALAVAIATGGELFRLERGRGERPSAAVGLAGIVALLVTAHFRGEHVVTAMPGIAAAVIGVTFVVLLARRDRGNATRALAYTLFPVLVVGLLGAYVVALRGARDGFRLVIVLLAMAIAADVAPLILGARGEHAHRSGRWGEGALSLCATLGVAVFAALVLAPPFNWSRAIVLAALVALVHVGADAGADMIDDALSRAEPGVRARRAPIFRRVDSVLFAAPFFFYAFRVLAR
jgi:hypothetical protein